MSAARFPWGQMLLRGASPRLLLLSVVVMLPPMIAGVLHTHWFFSDQLGHYAGGHAAAGSLDSFVLIQLLTQAGEPGLSEGIFHGIFGAILMALVLSPFLTGMVITEASNDEPSTFRELLRGGGDNYGRMMRMGFVALLPLLVAIVVAVVASKMGSRFADKAVRESSAENASHVRNAVLLFAFWFSHVTLEAGRAHFAAEPERKSAFLAWWSGIKLLFKRPGYVLGIAGLTSLSSTLLAALLVGLRLRVGQGSGGGVFLAFLLGQVAVAAVFWGRSSAVIGLAALVREQK